MWIAFRLILAVVGFVVRQLARGKKTASDGYYEGIAYFEKLHENKKRISGFTIGMERRSPTWLRCHAESSVDRFFKWLGVANEVQTGDARFDDLVYVACDHPYVQTLLCEQPELRDALVEVFNAGYKRVVFNGSTVAIERDVDHRPRPRDYQLLKQLYTASARLEDEMPSWFGDPFLWKALLVEGVIWSIAGYAIGAVVQMAVHREDFHLAHFDVIMLGIEVAVAAFVVLLLLIALGMRGSSRGHRVIVESALLLLFALPASGVQIVGDTNRALDEAPRMIVTREVQQCEVREHRGKRNRKWYSYHLWLQPAVEDEPPGLRIPQVIETTRQVCYANTTDKLVELEIGRGRWGLPWYRRITFGDQTWHSPL